MSLLYLVIPVSSQRSTDNLSYTVLPTRTKLGERVFSVTGPTAWNSLPYDSRKLTDTNTFKRHLKFYFVIIIFAYRPRLWFCCTLCSVLSL